MRDLGPWERDPDRGHVLHFGGLLATAWNDKRRKLGPLVSGHPFAWEVRRLNVDLGHGWLAGGVAPTLAQAKRCAVAVMGVLTGDSR